MARGIWQGTITDDLGNIQPGASVEVRRDIVGTPLATIYSDRDGLVPMDNPLTADDNGFVQFFAKGGPYKLTATYGGLTRIWRYVGIGTAQEADAEDLIVGIADEGQWATATNYSANNLVYDNGTTYICTAPHLSGSSTEPGVGADWQTVWRVFARRGGDNGGEWLWDTGTTAADPGTGKIRFNNASSASVTAIYINEQSGEVGNPSYAAWLATLSNSKDFLNRGYLMVKSVLGPSKFALYKVIAAVTDNGTYDTIPVGYIAGNGTFLSGEAISVTFTRNGDPGRNSIQQTYDSSSTAMADPGNGLFRANNATISSVTAFALDDQNVAGVDVSNYILTWDDSSSVIKGYLVLSRPDGGAVSEFAVFAVNSLVDNSGWTQLNVAYVAGATAFTTAFPFNMTFIRTGDRGSPTGIRYALDTTTTMADPTTGKFRLNNATLASVTAMAISYNNAEAGNPDSSAFVKTWDDSTSPIHGILTIVDVNAPQNYAQYNVTGTITDNTTWMQMTLAYLGAAGSFANTNVYALSFARAGDVGAPAGLHYTFETSTTMAAPASGALRLNNATLASVTAAAISNLNADVGNPDVSAFLATLDDSTTLTRRGLLKISKKNAPQNFAMYQISGANVDNSGWKQLALTYVASNGAFSAADDLAVEFFATGNVGTPTINVPFTIGDGANVIPTGFQAFLIGPFDFNWTITGWSAMAKQSGSISVDVLKFAFSGYDGGSTHPVAGDKISASAPIALSSAIKGSDTTLTGWTVAVAAGEAIELRCSSATTITQLNGSFKGTKTS